MKVRLDPNGPSLQHLDTMGRLHREDGPAVIYEDGSILWYRNGVLFRGNSRPYMITCSGIVESPVCAQSTVDRFVVRITTCEFNATYVNNELHNLLQPAIVARTGKGEWWAQGKPMK